MSCTSTEHQHEREALDARRRAHGTITLITTVTCTHEPHSHEFITSRTSHVHQTSSLPHFLTSSLHHHEHPHRSLPEIFALIDRSALSLAGRDRAKALFRRLAEAEAAIHQMPVEQVHLHEVGALDSIIDIVGAVFGLEWFAADTIVCSPLNVGGGMVDSAHGVFPVPAPATVTLLGDAPIYGGRIQQELVTPTGALIVSAYADSFGAIPPMAIERVGYGAGSRDFPTTPNVLRVLVGRAADRAAADRVVVMECEIDDMNPQLFGVVMDRLYGAGALEVFYVPVQMKKNRPGTLLTVVAPPSSTLHADRHRLPRDDDDRTAVCRGGPRVPAAGDHQCGDAGWRDQVQGRVAWRARDQRRPGIRGLRAPCGSPQSVREGRAGAGGRRLRRSTPGEC